MQVKPIQCSLLRICLSAPSSGHIGTRFWGQERHLITVAFPFESLSGRGLPYVPRNLHSQFGKGPMFPGTYVPNLEKDLYSQFWKGPMFPGTCSQFWKGSKIPIYSKDLCSLYSQITKRAYLYVPKSQNMLMLTIDACPSTTQLYACHHFMKLEIRLQY